MKLKSWHFKLSFIVLFFVILTLIIYFGFYFKNKTITNNNVKKDVETTIVSDIDGNLYHTIQIGNQVWLQENLKTTHYRNGDPIANVTNMTDWWNLNTGAYCWYNNDPQIGNVYGALYNWYTVNDPRGLAMPGWHVPTGTEWANLVTYLGGYQPAGARMIGLSSGLWINPIIADNLKPVNLGVGICHDFFIYGLRDFLQI